MTMTQFAAAFPIGALFVGFNVFWSAKGAV